jgi:hypothetical protein
MTLVFPLLALMFAQSSGNDLIALAQTQFDALNVSLAQTQFDALNVSPALSLAPAHDDEISLVEAMIAAEAQRNATAENEHATVSAAQSAPQELADDHSSPNDGISADDRPSDLPAENDVQAPIDVPQISEEVKGICVEWFTSMCDQMHIAADRFTAGWNAAALP